MRNIYMGIDIGSNYIKGILIDDNNKMLVGNFLKVDDDYLTTYKLVTDTLKSNLSSDDRIVNLCFTGIRKRLLERTMIGSFFKSDIRGIALFTRKYYPSIRTVMDIGNSLKIINIIDNDVSDYIIDNFNLYGSFIDKMINRLGIDVDKDIDIGKKKVFFKKMNTYLFDDNVIDGLINRYDKEEIILGIYVMVINSIKDNMKRIDCNREVLITGGLTLNKTFIRLLKSMINKKIFISNENIYTSIIGSVILVKDEESVTN